MGNRQPVAGYNIRRDDENNVDYPVSMQIVGMVVNYAIPMLAGLAFGE